MNFINQQPFHTMGKGVKNPKILLTYFMDATTHARQAAARVFAPTDKTESSMPQNLSTGFRAIGILSVAAR